MDSIWEVLWTWQDLLHPWGVISIVVVFLAILAAMIVALAKGKLRVKELVIGSWPGNEG